MADVRAKFLKILKAELEDLIEDIGLVERKAAERLAQAEITEYVFKENDGLLKQEAEAVRDLISVIDGMDSVCYKNGEELTADLDDRVKKVIRRNEDPEAVYRFFVRKMRKVRNYIDSEEPADD